jgi:hypothetical protein
MSENLPDLTIEPLDPESGLILVQQDSGGNLDRVALHPLHVRYMAERFGLVPCGDPTAARTIEALSRQMRLLRTRIDELDSMLLALAEKGRECFDEELAYSRATLDIANELCAILPELREGPSGAKPATASPKEPQGASLA